MVGDQDKKSFNIRDNIDINILYQDLSDISSKWDFNHRWNYHKNLLLYEEISKKYPFLRFSWILAIKEGKSIICKNCGKLLKDPLKNRTQYCSKCKNSSLERREKISNSKQSMSKVQLEISIKKRMNTTFERYGVYNISNLEFIKQKISSSQQGIPRPISKEKSILAQNKSYLTKKKNHSFKISKPERFSLFLLEFFLHDIKSQYRSKEYPFNCDCYIPSKSLYIEFNYSWTHGNHPYDEILDKEELENMKKSNSTYMRNAIETWTIRDPLKRKVAKENNLNYLEFFNMNDFLHWILKEISKKYPKITFKILTSAFHCFMRSGNLNSIPNFYLNNELIVKFDRRLKEHFFKDWLDEDKRLKVIKYMLENKLDSLNKDLYLSYYASSFFESKITQMLRKE